MVGNGPPWEWLDVGLRMAAVGMVVGCSSEHAPHPASLDEVAEAYVRLALAVGQHDPDYVDAFYGPAEWRHEAAAEPCSLAAIRTQAEALLGAMPGPAAGDDEMVALRRRYLRRQLTSLVARVDLLAGRRLRFDEESEALYEAVAPVWGEARFGKVLAELNRLLAELGFEQGSVTERYQAFREDFVVPLERLDAVFRAAIEGCRERTRAWIELPAGESFEIEYVTDRSWSAYNWYRGNYHSLIQVNTDLAIYVDRALDLACHEGYPGHHVYHALLEKHLVRGRGWVEYTVYPLFSPHSLISEGSANLGIEMAFPGRERLRFEKEVLFPLAGLDPGTAATYEAVHQLVDLLAYAETEAARNYLDGKLDAGATIDWLIRWAARTPEQAEQRLRFYDQYRSYVVNYHLGLDLVRAHVDASAPLTAGPEKRWQEFARLLSSPLLPSDLRTSSPQSAGEKPALPAISPR